MDAGRLQDGQPHPTLGPRHMVGNQVIGQVAMTHAGAVGRAHHPIPDRHTADGDGTQHPLKRQIDPSLRKEP